MFIVKKQILHLLLLFSESSEKIVVPLPLHFAPEKIVINYDKIKLRYPTCNLLLKILSCGNDLYTQAPVLNTLYFFITN